MAAFLRRHASSSMGLSPTETPKPPSSRIRTASGLATSLKPARGHIVFPCFALAHFATGFELAQWSAGESGGIALKAHKASPGRARAACLRRSHAATWAREWSPSLRRIFATWLPAVRSEMPSSGRDLAVGEAPGYENCTSRSRRVRSPAGSLGGWPGVPGRSASLDEGVPGCLFERHRPPLGQRFFPRCLPNWERAEARCGSCSARSSGEKGAMPVTSRAASAAPHSRAAREPPP